ncbi:hypothetical protein DFO70_1303 [Cytobacillus firmus]|uniref:Uncharacterized protein n=2 Tax=Cytobacillus TaxID=2675230 RepID=A0A366JHB6_CYTFI|nr:MULTISPECIES: hypothetical protein [Cytobacillus]RBP86197.1 hypothetical protein DFO70_1303 [Cytobacillus firmus]TDX45542.1 hypothetical protein DFO72_10210 [Cytobacillus oceanisediminis]
MKKKIVLVLSFALSSILVVGQFALADKPDSMMSGNGNGMMNMMEAMDSPEGQKMMKACGNFMDSYNSKE